MPEAAEVARAAAFIKDAAPGFAPEVALVTGTGLEGLGTAVEDAIPLDYADIPGFGESGVDGHPGQLLLGTLAGRRVALLHGRFHLYEGYSAREVARPVRALARLGAATFVVTNCAGALEASFAPPALMLITDQFNHTGQSPLAGAPEPELGERFVDMAHCYDRGLRELAHSCAAELGLTLHEGVYLAVAGPQLESNAERRAFRQLGAHAVGMSTVHEVIAARQAGMRVLGFSALANLATGADDQQPDSLEQMLAATAQVAGGLRRLILELLPRL